MVENLGADSDDDESKKPTVSVVIDEEEVHPEGNTENDQSEITSTTVEEVPSYLLEDHNYTGASAAANRSAPAWKEFNNDNNSEPFPVLEGLESYIADSDVEEQHRQAAYNTANSRIDVRRIRTRDDQSGRVSSSIPTVINANGPGGFAVRGQHVRQVYRDGYGPVPVQARRVVGGPGALPAVFNQRGPPTRIVRPGEYGGQMVRAAPSARTAIDGTGGYARYGPNAPTHHRAIISSSSSSSTASGGGYSNTAALIANDPSRMANDNAPAPLIIPARGAKPLQRNRIGAPNRMTMTSGYGGPSPRKVYQVTRGGNMGEYATAAANDMHSYAKMPPAEYDSGVGSDAVSQFQTPRGGARGGKYAAENGGSGGSAMEGGTPSTVVTGTDSPSAAIIDVVEEEEAQNAKFFQRQTHGGAIASGMLPKHQRTSSFNDQQQETQRITPIKPSSTEQQLVVDSPQHNTSRSPMSASRFRSVDGGSGGNITGMPSILQRHRLTSSQMPGEYGVPLMDHSQDYSYTMTPDTESIIASKQAQRPRGRPRGARTNSIGSDAAIQRQQQRRQMQKQQIYQQHQLEAAAAGELGGGGGSAQQYMSPGTAVLHHQAMPSSPMGGNAVVGSSSSTAAGAAVHASDFRHHHGALAGGLEQQQEQISSSSQDAQQRPTTTTGQQQLSNTQIAPQQQEYLYQQQQQPKHHHLQQHQLLEADIASAIPAEFAAHIQPSQTTSAVPPEFSHADEQILQHQQQLERQQQQEQLRQQQQMHHQQHHAMGGGQHQQQYQSLEDLAELAQLSQQQQQHGYIPSAQRPIYAGGSPPIYMPRSGGASPTKRQQQYMDAVVEHQQQQQRFDSTQQHHQMAANVGQPPPQQYYGAGGEEEPNIEQLQNYQPYGTFAENEQIPPGVYPSEHQMHAHRNLSMEKVKKPRKPRTPKEGGSEKKREKAPKTPKEKTTPRRSKKDKAVANATTTPGGVQDSQAEAIPPQQQRADAEPRGETASVQEKEKLSVSQAKQKQSHKKKPPPQLASSEDEEPTEDEEEEDSDEYGDYTTRCLCELTHNDEFMIACDKCDVWQHMVCMGVPTKNTPETYLCELCDPRPLKHTKQQAVLLQKRKLSKLEDKSQSRGSDKRRSKGKLNFKPKRGKPLLTKNVNSPAKKSGGVFKDFIQITENHYSRDVRSFVQQLLNQKEPNVGDTGLLKALKANTKNTKDKSTKNDENTRHRSARDGKEENAKEEPARQMFVASNVEGLVATYEVAAGAPLLEYKGCFSLASELSAHNKVPSGKNNFTLRYNGFGEDKTIVVDAAKMGSAARFVRRSCMPNTVIKHAIQDGRLHIILVASQDIDFSVEVTIPFDYDFTTSRVPVSCACGATEEQFSREGNDDCVVRKFNQALAMTNESLATQSDVKAQDAKVSPTRAVKRHSAAGAVRQSKSPTKKDDDRIKKEKPKVVEEPKKKAEELKTPKAELKSQEPRKTRSSIKQEGAAGDERSAPKEPLVASSSSADKPKSTVATTNEPSPPPSSISDVKGEDAKPISTPAITRAVKLQSDIVRQSRSPSKKDDEKAKKEKAKVVVEEPKKKIEPEESKKPKTELKSPEPRKTRSAVKQEEAGNEQPTANAPKEPPTASSTRTPQSADKAKLSREERKIQETVASYERLEKRRKQLEEKKANNSGSGQKRKPNVWAVLEQSPEKRAKTKVEPTEEAASSSSTPKFAPLAKKRASLRLLSSSSASSSASAASARGAKRVTVVDPKAKREIEAAASPSTLGKNSKRVSALANISDKESSSSKKKRLENKQISHVEAAQLLTEMASGMKSESADDDVKKDLRAKIVRAAEVALERSSTKPKKASEGFFALRGDYAPLTVSAVDKAAVKRTPKEASEEKAANTSKNFPAKQQPPPPKSTTKVEQSQQQQQQISSPAVERTKQQQHQQKPPAKEEPLKSALKKTPTLEKPTLAKNEKITGEVAASQRAIPSASPAAPSPISPASPIVTSAAGGTSATIVVTPSTAASVDATPSPTTPTVASLPNTKSVKKLTLAEYKKRQSSAALSTPTTSSASGGGDGRQLRSSPSKPLRGFMPSFKEVGSSSSSVAGISLAEPHLSPRSAVLSAMIPAEKSGGMELKLPVLSYESGGRTTTTTVPTTSTHDAPSIDELRRRIYGGKGVTKDAAEGVVPPSPSASTPSSSVPSSQPRPPLEERLQRLAAARFMPT